MELTLENIKTVIEICAPLILVIAWFIRLEAKVADHEERMNQTDTKSEKDQKLLQQMALDIQAIKTTMQWIEPILREKILK